MAQTQADLWAKTKRSGPHSLPPAGVVDSWGGLPPRSQTIKLPLLPPPPPGLNIVSKEHGCSPWGCFLENEEPSWGMLATQGIELDSSLYWFYLHVVSPDLFLCSAPLTLVLVQFIIISCLNYWISWFILSSITFSTVLPSEHSTRQHLSPSPIHLPLLRVCLLPAALWVKAELSNGPHY